LYCNKITDLKERYRIIREVYCIHPSFHELWFFDGHFNLFYKPKIGGIRSRLGLSSVATSIKNGTLPRRINAISTFLFKWAILLENLYASKVECSLFDYQSVNDEKLLENIHCLQKKSSPDVQKIIQDLPIIYESILTLMDRTGNYPLNPDVILSDKAILYYAYCAINEGPIFHKTSNESRLSIFEKISQRDPVEIQHELEKYFHIQTIRPFNVGNNGTLHHSANLSDKTKPKMAERIVTKNHYSEQTGNVKTKKDYSPEFRALIEEFRKSANPHYKGRETRHDKNYIVYCSELPKELRAYFFDFPQKRKFCIELDVNITRYPEYISIIEKISKKDFKRLPPSNPLFKERTKDGTWLRLQFFYLYNTPSHEVVQGMFDLIEQSIQEITKNPQV
jgi:hypothetical protein